MKKTLLTLAVALAGYCANSQVIFSVEAPSSIAGGYSLTYAKPSGGWTSLGDLIEPANAVLDTVVLAVDTSPTQDSLMCLSTGPNSLSGKIAMLYRGDCEFGLKAKNAFEAGAVAVIIVNNTDEAPIEMSPGAGTTPAGATVEVPVVMITKATGASIREKLDAGEDVVVFIGNKAGYYNNDLGTNLARISTSRVQAIPAALAQNGSEFGVNVKAYIFNYGENDQTGITVNAKISGGGSTYDETSDEFDMDAGADSVEVTFPAFSLSTYPQGEYTLTYTISSDSTDEYPFDNTVVTKFNITEDIYSIGRLDENGLPVLDGGSRPATSSGDFTTCIVFRNANADRLGAQGIYFAALKNEADGEITGEEITVSAYKWTNPFIDLSGITDVAEVLTNADVEQAAFGSYVFESDLQDTLLYAPFTTPFALENDQRYLFCATTSSDEVFLGYDRQTKYDVVEEDNQPTQAIQNGTGWGFGFIGGDVPAMAAKMFPIEELGLVESNTVEAAVYPNPAKDQVVISINGYKGDAEMTVTDLSGKVVMNRTVNVNGLVKVDLNGLNNGMYIFNMEMADGTVSRFNVVVNK